MEQKKSFKICEVNNKFLVRTISRLLRIICDSTQDLEYNDLCRFITRKILVVHKNFRSFTSIDGNMSNDGSTLYRYVSNIHISLRVFPFISIFVYTLDTFFVSSDLEVS